MRTIYRYDLAMEPEQFVSLPSNSKILTIQRQTRFPLALSMWALVDTDELLVERKIILVGTGTEDPGDHPYISTYQEASGFVWHFFDGGESEAFDASSIEADPMAAQRRGL